MLKISGAVAPAVLMFLSIVFNLRAQETPLVIKEIGTPFVKNYLPTEYGAHEQNYKIVQSKEGFLYIANVTGVIEFDGKSWSVDGRVTDDAFKGVAIGSDNLVYGSAKSIMGRYVPDSVGQLQFESLEPKISKDFTGFGDIRSVDALGDELIFRAKEQLLIYDIITDTTRVVSASGSFGRGDVVDNQYYIVDYDRGLLRLDGDDFTLLPGTEFLKQNIVEEILRFSKDELLLISRSSGLWKYDFKKMQSWDTEVSGFLNQHKGFAATNIQDQYFALGTTTGGTVIIDSTGQLVQKLDKEMGVGSNGVVQDLFFDKDQNLWIAQDGSISQVILNSPFTTIDDRHGVNGYVLYFQNWNNKTYVSTATGVVIKSESDPWQSTRPKYKPFKPISENRERVWMTVKQGGDFFSAGNNGFIQITENGLRTLLDNGERMWAAVAMQGGDEMIIGSIEGYLHRFIKKEGRWSYDSRIKGFNKQMDFLEQTEDGDIWMTDSGTGVFKIKLNERRDSAVSVKVYGPNEGLPELARNRVFRHEQGLLFATGAGVYKYNIVADRFEPVEKFNKHLSEDYVFRLIEMKNGDVYGALNPRGKSLLRKVGDDYELTMVPFQRIAGHNSEYVSGLGGSDVWIAGTGIKHYKSGYEHRPPAFKAYVRSVRVSNKNDSLIYAGGNIDQSIELRPKENAIYFDYSATYYDKSEEIEFQSYLEGSEDTWAPWSDQAARNYTNLSHGTYTFKVRAKNLYGDVSDIGEYTFSIHTPWYLTIWAYILYAILVALSVWLIVKLNTRRLENEKKLLEEAILARTQEIRTQKEKAEADKTLIQQQADRLRELDKVKSRFFANISHELRTPLTLINAPLESLIESGKISDEEIRTTLKVAKRNGVSLLSLVEEILDLAKLEAGKLKLVENPVQLKEFLSDILSNYTSALQEKGIQLKLDYWPEENLTILLDENKYGKIVRNLISNALKFTKDEIAIQVQYSSDSKEQIQLIITDNGVGIDAVDLQYIFDRYYQSEKPENKAEGGTGIGLALAKELTELMSGSLKVSSQLNIGSVFTIEVPLKEVKEETIVPLTKADNEVLDIALRETIANYSVKFSIDKPVLLITEDHPEMRAFIAKTLTPYFSVLQAQNGIEALEILKVQSVDIIISDVMMPLMDGFELLEAIKKDEKLHQISIVMLTARADQEDRLYALTLGIDDYLTKPFSAAVFLARIKNILENRIKVIREFKMMVESTSLVDNKNVSKLIDAYHLSEREVEVMRLLAKRLTNAEIAEKLFVSTNTVKYHVKNLYSKLGVASRSQVVDRLEAIK
ncbi:response regulator [Roseivirga sp. E12]|uniref:response regulator n=1 Tax=Roseivirga sp. E12 TaxID=2819237 RepID=UPI001ABD0A67|nr:response regulator [Roseivirga sp. E12]MBO3700650.1 response regulator [Roseivirga sp. E12]